MRNNLHKNSRRFYRAPPVIPGMVYDSRKKTRNSIFACLFSSFFIFLYPYMAPTQEPPYYPALLASLIAYALYITWSSIKNVFLTEQRLKAEYNNGKTLDEPLDQYRLVIGKARCSSPLTKNYCYRIFLSARQNTAASIFDTFSRHMPPRKPDIPIRDRIFNPVNLKENVEAIQRQVIQPFPVVFTSKQLEQDYKSGVFKSRA